MSFEDHLTSAMRASVDTLAAPVTELAGGGLQRGRQLRRRRRLAAGGAAIALVAVAGAGTAALVRDDGSQQPVVTTSGGCAAALRTGVLPTWGRDGFSDPRPKVPHVLSEDGRMLAILFGPLQSPTAEGRNNKVLWVTRPDSAGYPLDIAAVRAGSDGTVVHRHLEGPGPSTVDLPEPGCWTLTLRWGEFRDTIDLEYARP
jgi:hypothetical protein